MAQVKTKEGWKQLYDGQAHTALPESWLWLQARRWAQNQFSSVGLGVPIYTVGMSLKAPRHCEYWHPFVHRHSLSTSRGYWELHLTPSFKQVPIHAIPARHQSSTGLFRRALCVFVYSEAPFSHLLSTCLFLTFHLNNDWIPGCVWTLHTIKC